MLARTHQPRPRRAPAAVGRLVPPSKVRLKPRRRCLLLRQPRLPNRAPRPSLRLPPLKMAKPKLPHGAHGPAVWPAPRAVAAAPSASSFSKRLRPALESHWRAQRGAAAEVPAVPFPRWYLDAQRVVAGGQIQPEWDRLIDVARIIGPYVEQYRLRLPDRLIA